MYFEQQISMFRIRFFVIFGLILMFFGTPLIPKQIEPDYIGILILFWALARTELQPSLKFVFFVGILTDVITTELLGIHALKYLCALLLATIVSRYFLTSSYGIKMFIFGVLLVTLEFFGVLALTLLAGDRLYLEKLPWLFIWALSWPLLHWMLIGKNFKDQNMSLKMKQRI